MIQQSELTIYTDGASRGNPGPSAAAIVITLDNQVIFEKAYRLPDTTNNTAEYTALFKAAEWLREHTLEATVHFFADSELMVKQMKGEYKIKQDHLRELAMQTQKLLKSTNDWDITHVPRIQNKRADQLCNELLDAQTN